MVQGRGGAPWASARLDMSRGFLRSTSASPSTTCTKECGDESDGAVRRGGGAVRFGGGLRGPRLHRAAEVLGEAGRGGDGRGAAGESVGEARAWPW
jgi:hypothetical protein